VATSFVFCSAASAQNATSNQAADANSMKLLGGNTMTALLAADQQDITNELAASANIDPGLIASHPMGTYQQLYGATGGGPTLQWLGVNLSSLTNNGSFTFLYWTVILVFGGLASGKAMMTLRRSNTDYIDQLAAFVLKLFAGVIIVANPSLIYAAAMTLRDGFNQVANAMVSYVPQAVANIQQTNLATMNLNYLKSKSIDEAIRERIGLTQSFENDTQRQAMGNMLNSLATAVNQAAGNDLVPIASSDEMANATVHERIMADQFTKAFRAIATMQSPTSINVTLPDGSTAAIQTLGAALNDPNSAIGQAQNTVATTPNTQANQSAIQGATNTFGSKVMSLAKAGLDTALASVLPGAQAALWLPTAGKKVLEAAAGAATDFVRKAMEAIIGIINIGLAYIIARGSNIVLNLLIELNVMLLVVVMPLWLLPTTSAAFTGAIRSIFNATLVMPTFQIAMFITDAVFSKVMNYVSVAATAGAISTVFIGPMALLAIMLGYIVAYVAVIVLILWKTPSMLHKMFTGAGVVSAFLGAQLTGMAAGIMTAVGIGAAPAMVSKFGGIAGGLGGGGGSPTSAVLGQRMPAGAQAASAAVQGVVPAASPSVASRVARMAAGWRGTASTGSGAQTGANTHKSFTNPFGHAAGVAAKELAAAASSEDPGSYLAQRGGK
jgi:hypothetical protein